MAKAYDKSFLIEAFCSRYKEVLDRDSDEARFNYLVMAADFYDKVGKDKFRVWASLDADAIKLFKASKK
jgi:hypothetical protein